MSVEGVGRRGSDRGAVAALCLVLALAVLAVYAPVARYGFLDLDDDSYVTRNPHVLAGLTKEGLVWAMTSVGYSANWHPLTWLSHMADVQLFGLRGGAHHVVNATFHALNAVVLFFLLRTATGALRASAVTAALFAVHPLNVESVAWIAERKNVLSTLLWLAAMATYVRYARRPTGGRYLLTLAIFALGLLAKPMLVTLPFVLLLLDFWPLGRIGVAGAGAGDGGPHPARSLTGWEVALEKAPLLCLSAGSAALTYLAQSRGGLVGSLKAYPFDERLANALLAYVAYAWKMIWPAKLAFFYPYLGDTLPLAAALVSGFALVAISVALVLAARRLPFLAVGWFWYLGTLVPVIGLVQVGSQGLADRYAYVPLIGLFVALVWLVDRVVKAPRARSVALPLAGTAVLTLLALAAARQVGHWREGIALFSHTLRVTEGNWLAENNFGVYLDRLGRRDEAIAHYERALAIRPSFSQAHSNLGVALASQQRWPEAIEHYREAIRLMPDSATAHLNLGMALAGQGENESALAHYARALRLGSDPVATRFGMAMALESQGKRDEAALQYREVLRLAPDHRAARVRLERIAGRR